MKRYPYTLTPCYAPRHRGAALVAVVVIVAVLSAAAVAVLA